MKIRSVAKLTMLAAVLLHTSLGYADDLFSHNKPVAFKPAQMLAPAQTVGGYPILSTGGNLVILDLRTSFAGGGDTALPMGLAAFADAPKNKLLALVHMQANLAQAGAAIDWTDEPCKGNDFLWKKSIGRAFTEINCATITHVTKFLPDYPSAVRVQFTRYSSLARRLSYIVSVNPAFFGIENDPEPDWKTNSWHQDHLQKDPKKVEFLAKLEKWAEAVLGRMDDAFNMKPDAFADVPPLASYFPDSQQIDQAEKPQ